jgi:hypothetical protein
VMLLPRVRSKLQSSLRVHILDIFEKYSSLLSSTGLCSKLLHISFSSNKQWEYLDISEGRWDMSFDLAATIYHNFMRPKQALHTREVSGALLKGTGSARNCSSDLSPSKMVDRKPRWRTIKPQSTPHGKTLS